MKRETLKSVRTLNHINGRYSRYCRFYIDTARYLDLTDWSGDSYSHAEEMDYASQRFAVIDLPDDANPQTQTFDGRKYLTDEAFYNSLISGGVEWEPLVKE